MHLIDSGSVQINQLSEVLNYALFKLLAEQDFESSSSTFPIHNMTLSLNLGKSFSVVRDPNIVCTTKKEKENAN